MTIPGTRDRHLHLGWHLLLLALCSGLVLAGAIACGDDNGSSENTNGPPPAGVPQDAQLVETLEFGEESAPDDPESADVLTMMRCDDDVLIVATAKQQVHAELPCDRMPSEEIVREYVGEFVKVTLQHRDAGAGCVGDGACGKLFVRSDAAGSLEFTVGRAWSSDKR